MKIILRRRLAAALALCLALSLYIPARADEDVDAETAPELPAEAAATEIMAEDAAIDVVVPGNGSIIINPYHIPVGEDADTAQIIHRPQAIYNNSAAPVTVDVSLVGTVPPESGAALVYGSPMPGGKEVFLYAEFQSEPDLWAETYTGAPNQLVAVEAGTYGEDILTLEAHGEGYFRFSGAMSGGCDWADTDTFGAVLVFTFSAVPVAAEAAEKEAGAPLADIAEPAPGSEESEEAPTEPEDDTEPEIPPAEPEDDTEPEDPPAEPEDDTEPEESPAEPEDDAEPEESPAEPEAPPAEPEAPPAEPEAPPAEPEAPPAESEAPPAESESPPAESDAPPAAAE